VRSNADPPHFRLDRLEQGVVDLAAGMPKDQHRRTHQAVRNRNHVIAAHRADELGLEAWWRSQDAVNDDTAADHQRPGEIRRPYGRKQVRERRGRLDEHGASHAIFMGREGEWRELGQGDWRPGIEGRDQLPQGLCTASRRAHVGLNPHRLQHEASQCSVLPLPIEGGDRGPGHGMSDPEPAARITEEPTPAACDPIQPATADPRCHGSCPRDQGIAIQRRSSGVEDPE
jgi:hypothetical protein